MVLSDVLAASVTGNKAGGAEHDVVVCAAVVRAKGVVSIVRAIPVAKHLVVARGRSVLIAVDLALWLALVVAVSPKLVVDLKVRVLW